MATKARKSARKGAKKSSARKGARRPMARKSAKKSTARKGGARKGGARKATSRSAPKRSRPAAKKRRQSPVARVKRVAREVAQQASSAMSSGVETLRDFGETIVDRVRQD